mgnify:CR=1 FL=1
MAYPTTKLSSRFGEEERLYHHREFFGEKFLVGYAVTGVDPEGIGDIGRHKHYIVLLGIAFRVAVAVGQGVIIAASVDQVYGLELHARLIYPGMAAAHGERRTARILRVIAVIIRRIDNGYIDIMSETLASEIKTHITHDWISPFKNCFLYSLGVMFSCFRNIWVKWEKLLYPSSEATMLMGMFGFFRRSLAASTLMRRI